MDTRYVFEVNVKQKLVRNVIGDYGLEEFYGIIDTKEKLYKYCNKTFRAVSAHFYKKGRLPIFKQLTLYKRFIDLVKYNHANNLEFERSLLFERPTRKPIFRALIEQYSDKTQGNNLPEIYKDEYGDDIYKYHAELISILNDQLQKAHD